MTAIERKNLALPRRLLLAGLLLLALFLWLERNLTQVMLTLADARAQVMAVQALNEAAEEIIQQGVSYESLVDVSLGSDGSVRLLQANAAGMNRLASQASLLAQEKLDALENQSVSVPLGSALGVALLSGMGPDIRVSILPVGAVVTQFATEFTSAGINQTRHRVFLTMRAQVRLVLPAGASVVEAVTQVAVAESIIVGDVPDSYVNVDTIDNMLNLIP